MLAVANPHHGGETLLRTTLVPALLRCLERNLNADAPLPVRLFQVGKAFLPALAGRTGRRPGEERLPAEPRYLQCVVAGLGTEAWGVLPGEAAEVRAVVDQLATRLRLPLACEPADAEPYLQPGLQWRLLLDDRPVGALGMLAPAVRRHFDLEPPVALLEWNLDAAPLDPRPLVYAPFPRYPAAKRDLSLVVPAGVTYAEVEAVIREAGGPHLALVRLFDRYQGQGLPEGAAALGIRLKFQSDRGSLKGKAVDKAVAAITDALASRLQVTLRS